MKNPRNDPKIERLKWVVDFFNADLQKLDRGEKLYIYVGLECFVGTVNFNPVSKKEIYEEWVPKTYKVEIPPEIWKKASLIQQKFKEFLAPIVSLDEEGFESLSRIEFPNDQGIALEKELMMAPVLKELPSISVTPTIEVASDRRFHFGLRPTERVNDLLEDRSILEDGELLRDHWEGVYEVFWRDWSCLKPRDPSIFEDRWINKETLLKIMLENPRVLNFSVEVYLFMLGRLYDDLPYTWIRKCRGRNKDKECGRYFLNPTERIKEYCDSSCASRSIQQKKRDGLKQDKEKYEAYKKKMRKYMAKRYLKMRQAQFGPNVKIGRKVRRRKED